MPRARNPDRARSRLDAELVSRGLAETRTRAQALIMGGSVTVNGETVTKPAAPVDASAAIEVDDRSLPYVSRGGLKLRHALEHFVLPLRNAVAVDVGASTGGFTDVLLQSGVARVYAIDVGYGQLAWKLRNDPRVVVMERTNIRKVAELPEPIDVCVIDTSFISLRQVLPAVWPLLRDGGHVVALVKPQFEAGRADVGKKGVVRDPVVWRRVLQEVVRRAQDGGWSVIGVERSPIRGPAGNVEFLAHLVKDGVSQGDTGAMIDRVIVDDGGRPDMDSGSSSLR